MTNNVTVGIGNKIDVSEAAKLLGCSRSTVNNMIKGKKIKAQMIEGTWYAEYDDVYRFKGIVKGRKFVSRKQVLIQAPKQVKEVGNGQHVPIKFEIARGKFELINHVLTVNGTTLTKYVTDHLNELYDKSIAKLKFDKPIT